MNKIPNKTLKCGFTMPVFGMGTWMLGGDSERDVTDNGDLAVSALRRGLELGLRHIDTAEMYAAGFSEEITGRAIADWSREKLFITSKVWHENLAYDDVLRAVEGSLKRIKTDYLDLYLIHKPNDEFPMSETFRALDKLVDEKVVRNIGVSNFTVQRLIQAQKLSAHKIVANQVHFNLVCREPEAEGLVAHALENDLMITAWRPLQMGSIINAEILKPLAAKYNKSPAQIALNWVVSQPNTVTMSTMRNPDHIAENIAAVTWQMEASDLEMLSNDFPGQMKISDAIPMT